MENAKRKRGRPPKRKAMEFEGIFLTETAIERCYLIRV